MRVEWLPAALGDRDSILAYLEPLNPYAAMKLLQALVLAGDSLTMVPSRGRPGLVPGTRELVAVWPYIIVYEIDQSAGIVRILRLWHGAQAR